MSVTNKYFLTLMKYSRAYKHNLAGEKEISKLKAERIKWIQKENRIMFGNLLENQKERQRRMKLESKGLLPEQETTDKDSELSWVLRKTSPNRLRIVSTKWRQVEDEKQCDNNKGNDDKKQTTDSSICEKKDVGSDENVSDNSTEFLDNDKDMPILDPDPSKTTPQIQNVIVNHLLTFPIFSESKPILPSTGTVSFKRDPSSPYMPSVTMVLRETLSDKAKEALKRWEEKLKEELGEEGFKKYSQELLENGRLFHSCIENTLRGERGEIPAKVELAYKSMESLFDEITDVRAVESHVIHPKLVYHGVVDCVARYRGKLCVIDWKKSEKKKGTLAAHYDAPLQLASYVGALNASENYPFTVEKAVVVAAYTNGAPATVHEIEGNNLQKYWRMWLERLQMYHAVAKKTKTSV